MHKLIRLGDQTCFQIHLDVAELDDTVGIHARLPQTPQGGMYTRQQLADTERLAQIIVGARIERLEILDHALAHQEYCKNGRDERQHIEG